MDRKKAGDDLSTKVVSSLEANRKILEKQLVHCADINRKEIWVGRNLDVKCLLIYMESTLSNTEFNHSSVGKAMDGLRKSEPEEIRELINKNGFAVPDLSLLTTIEEALQSMFAGNVMILVDGYDKILKIQDKGYPGLGIHETQSEKNIRGSDESFCESVKMNAVLLRKRIRSSGVKVLEFKTGVRADTLVYLMYIDEIANLKVVREMEQRLSEFSIDGALDTGVIEQLTEKKSYSPFPQFQSTRRPDRGAEALLAGRVVLLSDNSPEALLLPATYQTFLQTADDGFSRFEIASFSRILRYLASFLAMVFPGLYLVAVNFHNQMIPEKLLLSLAAASTGTPFPAIVEVLLMEIAFELLREAGVRMPGNMGNAIGIVGGLIVGQAAVEANLVSPIVVIVVALTALCSFSIPSEDLSNAFRLLKFVFLGSCGFFGFFGFLVSLTFVLLHMANLESFSVPYLAPVSIGLRRPIYMETKRPIFAKKENRIRLNRKERKE
ncbi:MAG: spore germination protein [Lachnospiraceae bacterium]